MRLLRLLAAFSHRASFAVLWAVAGLGCQVSEVSSRASGLDLYYVGTRPRSIAVADLNGDEHRDVVVANSGDGTLTILLGNEGGRLHPLAPVMPGGNEPSDVEPVDLDRDGDLDLVVANHETPEVSVLVNDGDARFTADRGSPFDSGARPHVHGLATGDFNGDGWSDVAVESADTREVRVLPGGPGGLGKPIAVPVGTMPYHRLGAADVTGDGIPEVLVPGHADSTVRFVRIVDGRLTLSPEKIELPDKPWMVVGDDVNADGRNDVIVVHSQAVSIWLATSRGFSPAPGSPIAVAGATEAATGDLTGDGIADVAVGPWDGNDVTIVQGGTLAVGRLRACGRPIGLAIADLDGDRRAELLVACASANQLAVVRWPAAK